MTKKQKQKLIYTLSALLAIGIIVFISVMFYGDVPWAEELKNKIAASLITYASGLFLVVKVITFIVQEALKAKQNKYFKEYVKNGENLMEKGDLKMKNNDFTYNGFTFKVDERKGIKITFDGADIMGPEDFYKKLRQANDEFLEHFRKRLAGER